MKVSPIDRELLMELYNVRGLSCVQISKELHCAPKRVIKCMIEFGIPRRKQGQYRIIKIKKVEELTEKLSIPKVIITKPQKTEGACRHKACPFPSVFDNLCRIHFRDEKSYESLHGSTSSLAIGKAHIFYS